MALSEKDVKEGGEAARIRILHLEDSKADAELVQRRIEGEGLQCDIILTSNKESFESALSQGKFDLILSDHCLPGYNGFLALQLARQRQPEVPFIMISGTLDDAEAVASLKGGATDYVLKQRLARLVPAIHRALRDAHEQKRQQVAEHRIREQANLLNLTGDAIIVRTVDDRIVFWNKTAENLFGWTEEQVLEQDFAQTLGGDTLILADAKRGLLESGDWIGELRFKTRSGEEITTLSRWKLMRDKEGNPHAILAADTDITDKKKLELIALRAQRMDSIGALAGGIAHDLNNALAPVLMSAEVLKNCKQVQESDHLLDIILTSAHRATGMVKQILRFARGNGEAGALRVDSLIHELAKIVRDTFPKSIQIFVNAGGEEIWQIQGDPTELHQVLLNLCVNARDAMANSGKLTIAVQNTTVNGEAVRLNTTPGPYVMFSVTDTGSGVPPEVLPRIFEPFFTTKLPDKGTGLGLFTVANIIKRHGGCIDIKTEVGQGTEFKVYIPALKTAAQDAKVTPPQADLPVGHGELILVIEDEMAVSELTKTILEAYGYRVITAQNGIQGISLFEEHRNEIKVLVTDTDMPYIDGMGAIQAIKELKPDIPVIIASGSKRDTEQMRKIDAKQVTSLGKPFSAEQLLIAVAMATQV